MITINNNYIVIGKEEENYEHLRRMLVKVHLLKHINYFAYQATRSADKYNIPEVDKEIETLNRQLRQRSFDKCDCFYTAFYMYNLDKDLNMYIPIGLIEFVKPYFSSNIKFNYDIKNRLVDTNKVISNLDNKILPGITLREEQMEATKLCLLLKRTIIQIATGGGKSEIMCAFIKSLQKEIGNCPTTLLLEPTDKLKNEMIDRFKKYGINAVDYGKNRKIVEGAVNITHPMSLNNDLEKDPDLLKEVKVFMEDECHHCKSDTSTTVILNIPNAEYNIGVSASAISQEHINETWLSNYTVDEIKMMSMLGKVSMNITAADLIKQGKLAKPCLLVISNPANEKLRKGKENDWHEINKVRLQSFARTLQIAQTACFFSNKNRKTLILVNTKEYAYNIAKEVSKLGLNSQCRLSFGGKKFLKYNECTEDFENDDSDTFQDYRDGKISILIGTQHLVEGVDVPSLDTVILAYCGKSERIQIQSCGRVLRITKNGNMAYIVDFSDYKDGILNYQFKNRLSRYLSVIGVNKENVYVINNENIENDLEKVFNKYEKEE